MDNDRSQNILGFNKSDVISFEDVTIKVDNFDTKVNSIAVSQGIFHAFNSAITSWQRFAQAVGNRRSFNWLEGVPCEVLKAGSSQWQKGKLKLKVHFEFDFEPDTQSESITSTQPSAGESPLDEIRQMISEE